MNMNYILAATSTGELLKSPLILVILIVVGCIPLSIYLYKRISAYIAKRKFEKQISIISPKVQEALDKLKTFFLPTHRVSQEDVEGFLSEYKSTQEDIQKLQNIDYTDDSVLSECGIDTFNDQVQDSRLYELMEENNLVYDSIANMKRYTVTAINAYHDLLVSDNYFTFSQAERYLASLSDFDSYANRVIPQYAVYITDERTKEVLRIKENVGQERAAHNRAFIQRELADNRSYFDTVLGDYPLDQQQRDSIVKLEDNCLVIASAGSGKTSTILGKAKYLVERRHIDPSRILLITYTRKAANELHERMNIEGITCCTFHALAYKIIGRVTGQAPTFCKAELSLNVFYHLLEHNSDFLHAINNYIINQQSLMGLEHDYDDAFSYFEDRKKYGIQALFPDVDGNIIFTRSEEEKRLVSILTRLGVPFRYENVYKHYTLSAERRLYRPDFTIYYQDNNGEWKWLYLEHFAIDANGNVPRWFGEGTRGGWRVANQKYNEGIQWKRRTHQEHGTILIETTSADFRNGTVEAKLREQLASYGVPIRERTDKELYDLLVSRTRKLEKSVYTLIMSFITLMKANEKTIDGLLNENPGNLLPNARQNDIRNRNILSDIIKPFYEEYEKSLEREYLIDYTDAIIQATDLCRRGLWQHYDYILVDEFQDISIDRYKFLQALRNDSLKSKLFCVGDDWQSIFRFAGSDMSLVYEFERYFGFTEFCKIETTYRFHQPLIDKSSEFIMKNQEQRPKTIRTPEGDRYSTYLHFVKCDCEKDDGVIREVENIINKTPTDQSIILLGRYNYDARSVGYKGDIDMSVNRMMVTIGGREIPFLSVHSAKGLEADNVILVNCNQGAYGFPSLIEDDPILDFVLSKKEAYPFAEERRLFYVAMTRAKKNVYVLYDQKRPSPFIGEFLLKIERGSYLCPRCLDGKMIAIKDGVTTNGEKFRSFVCSNKESGCDFFETKYGDLTPPGICVTEEMTIQDIERIREVRRNRQHQHVPTPEEIMERETPQNVPYEGTMDDLPF